MVKEFLLMPGKLKLVVCFHQREKSQLPISQNTFPANLLKTEIIGAKFQVSGTNFIFQLKTC